tara:strand:- start:148 stop:423 length:276 start_codon:yes stop_codon:yes gene_type:complete
MGFFGLELALGVPKSARIEKIKKYGFFKVNSEQGYFFDFSDSGPCGLPGGFCGKNPTTLLGAGQPFFGLKSALGPGKVPEWQKLKNTVSLK